MDPVAEHTEIESGRKNDRTELGKALAACRLHRATLLIAKIDRLSRDGAFLLNLRDAGVEFVAADMPAANRMTVGLMAIIAEHEREQISQRTRAALAQRRCAAPRWATRTGYPTPPPRGWQTSPPKSVRSRPLASTRCPPSPPR
jgi:DNA invertase Pin-like site-specific DNA recombinase